MAVIETADGTHVATFIGQGSTRVAQYIVELANSHDGLLNALRAIVKAYDGPTVDAATAVSSHIQAARMAIKAAENIRL